MLVLFSALIESNKPIDTIVKDGPPAAICFHVTVCLETGLTVYTPVSLKPAEINSAQSRAVESEMRMLNLFRKSH